MSNKATSLNFTWDRSLAGEVAAAVAAQEARHLLPMGTSTLVSGGILFLSKTEVAAIVTHDRSLGRLKIGETFVHVGKREESDDETDDASGSPPAERTPEESEEYLKMAAAAIFVQDQDTPSAPAKKPALTRWARALASVF